MPAPLVLAGLIAGGATLATGVGHWLGNRRANKENIEMQKRAQDYDKQMWEMQNAYNTPTNQMQRLKAAGLNPNLVYGSGNVTSQATSRPAPHVATIKNEMENVVPQTSNALQILGAYNDYQVKKAQVDNIESTTKLNDAKLLNEQIRNPLLSTKLGQEQLKYSQSQKLADTQVSSAEANLLKLRLLNTKTGYFNKNILPTEAGMKKLEYEMQSNLKPYGVTTSDALWQRVLMQLLPQVNKDLNIKQYFK